MLALKRNGTLHPNNEKLFLSDKDPCPGASLKGWSDRDFFKFRYRSAAGVPLFLGPAIILPGGECNDNPVSEQNTTIFMENIKNLECSRGLTPAAMAPPNSHYSR
jgi:hypothetical protein